MVDGPTPGLILWKLTLVLVFAVLLIWCVLFPVQLSSPHGFYYFQPYGKNRDLPVLLAFIMATGSAWATHAVGLSPALGAFAAGALLAVSPFSTQIRADMRPLTTLMVTLFFASIGMFGDPVLAVGPLAGRHEHRAGHRGRQAADHRLAVARLRPTVALCSSRGTLPGPGRRIFLCARRDRAGRCRRRGADYADYVPRNGLSDCCDAAIDSLSRRCSTLQTGACCERWVLRWRKTARPPTATAKPSAA